MTRLRSRTALTLVFLYIAVSLTYQLVASISLVIGYFDLRHQVRAPFEIDFRSSSVSSVTEPAKLAGLRVGDRIESLNGTPYWGRALWQRVRWYARVGDVLNVGVRRSDNARASLAVPLSGYTNRTNAKNTLNNVSPGEAVFVIIIHIVVPLFCLALGYWVALVRPTDPNAWFIFILLSFPEAFISVSTYNWLPDWLPLRLAWHLILLILAPGALLWLGLRFPERSRIDSRVPWLKWAITFVLGLGIVVDLAMDYCNWYQAPLVARLSPIDAANDKAMNWAMVVCLVLYWIALFDKLRTASTPDSRRRLRVLWTGSIVGLGSLLFIWGALPRFGIADPASIQWLGYVSAVLMLAFPLTLAYVVIVQRAMDVRILLRMGTRYALARSTLAILQLAAAALLTGYIVRFFLTHHHGNTSALVFAVLAIVCLATLFFIRGSISSRVQNWLDRQFFRESYNAELILNELVEQARRFTEPRALIETVSRRISDALHVPQICVLLDNGGMFQLQQTIGLSLNRELALPASSATIQYLRQAETPAVLQNRNLDHWFAGASEHERHILQEARAELLLPLPGREKLFGLMMLGPKQSEEAYSPLDLRLLGSVGTQTGLALEVAELANSLAAEAAQRARIYREIEIAREVQERLFPQQFPVRDGLSLAGTCRPAQAVGGDYYDVIELEDSRLGLAIGDVSGKGISAALLMASVRACLRTMTLVGTIKLAQLMEKMNQLVYESSAVNRYATFFFAIYDPATRKLEYVNAGHNPPVILRKAEGGFEHLRLGTGGPVIGLLPHMPYEQASVTLESGDTLLTYTDGISEAMTEKDEEWGEERMLQAVEAARRGSADEVVKAIFADADRFTGSAPQHDDMTLLVLTVG